jgi:nitrogen fixation protein FixH
MSAFFRRPITGAKAFAIFASFFLVIIVVNMILAVQAVRTFPGLEVRNSFVASQGFEASRDAQEALGWTAAVRLAGDELVLTIHDARGPVRGAAVEATLRRVATRAEDRALALAWDGAAWRAPVQLAGGQWLVAVSARAADGTAFRQRLEIVAR